MIFDEFTCKKPDYSKAYCLANELLTSSRMIEYFPYKVNRFIKEHSDIKLCTYAKALNKYKIPIDQFGSESAVIIEKGGAAIIFYNQDEVEYRSRFGIMHEFGHYILGHKFNLQEDEELYYIQEIEANFFAAQMLIPEQILRECIKRGKRITTEFIMNAFSVSEEAATKRIKTLQNRKMEYGPEEEKKFDDIIIFKYSTVIDKIAPINRSIYNFDDEYELQINRDSWY